jgi:hypothetical protein
VDEVRGAQGVLAALAAQAGAGACVKIPVEALEELVEGCGIAVPLLDEQGGDVRRVRWQRHGGSPSYEAQPRF